MTGFITDDGYGAIPYGNQLMIIYNNQQLEIVKTKKLAEKFISDHRASSDSGTVITKKSTVRKTKDLNYEKNITSQTSKSNQKRH